MTESSKAVVPERWRAVYDDDYLDDKFKQAVEELGTAEHELTVAHEQLKKYATHRQGCPASFMKMSNEPCTCGLEAALTQPAAKGEKICL